MNTPSEAETGCEFQVTVTVVETVVGTRVPVSLMAESHGIEEIARRAHEGHTPIEVGGQERSFPLDGIRETMAIANARNDGDIVKPAVMEHPTVAVSYHEPEVSVTEAVISNLIRKIGLEIIIYLAHVHDDILMTQIDACHQGACASLLVLGETIGSGLGIVGVVEDVIGIQAIPLAFEA